MIDSELTLIIFTRYPMPGVVKTRLIPAVGAAGAALLHRQMTESTMGKARELCKRLPVSIAVHFDGSDHRQMADWLGTDLVYQSQGEGDLGVRMDRSISSYCQVGYNHVILIGTDCPELTAEILARAFELLLNRDLVLGAALDGGYYLIGMRHPQPELFVDIDWGTDRVLQQTIDSAKRLNLAIGYLPTLADIDRPEDLPLLTRQYPRLLQEVGDISSLASSKAKISIVIPVLNEAATIAKVLADLHSLPNVEVIVIDGGSSDDTISIVAGLGIKVIPAEKGRARQMNVGAKAATGEILLFLHADTILPLGFETMVRSTLQEPLRGEKHGHTDYRLISLLEWLRRFLPPQPPLERGAFAPSPFQGEGWGGVKDYAATPTDSSVPSRPIAGAFTLQIDDPLPSLRWIEKLVAWRSKWRQMPYGDQAIFLTAATFWELGGFVEMPIMEDFELIRQLQRRGRIEILDAPVMTSARRWLQRGVWQTTLINQSIVIGYLIGVSPARLATWYRLRN